MIAVLLLGGWKKADATQSKGLPKQFHDRLALGQQPRNPAGILRVVDGNIEGVIDRGGQFFRTHGIVRGILAVLVGTTVNVAALDAGTGNDR